MERSQSMKRVLILIPSLGLGGAERSASQLYTYLAKTYKVYLCVFSCATEMENSNDQMQILNLNTPYSKNIIGKIIILIKRSFRLYKIIKDFQIDVVISFMTVSNFLNILIPINHKKIISIRSYDLFRKRSFTNKEKLIRILEKLLYKHADKIIVVSQVLKNAIIKQYNLLPKKVGVIYNSFDSKDIFKKSIVSIDSRYKNLTCYPIIATVGRLEEAKGYDHLIKIFSYIKKYVTTAKLIIVGNGSLQKKLYDTAKFNGLAVWLKNKNQLDSIDGFDVILTGEQSNPFPYIVNAIAFVLTSIYEGFPNVLTEAMCLGLPIIAADCLSGPREIIAPHMSLDSLPTLKPIECEYGILMPVFDKNNTINTILHNNELVWAQRIIELLNNSEEQKKFRNKSLIRCKFFQSSSINLEWNKLIDNI
jgi:glycosyltransferase involved in cell wall biosynthesis